MNINIYPGFDIDRFREHNPGLKIKRVFNMLHVTENPACGKPMADGRKIS